MFWFKLAQWVNNIFRGKKVLITGDTGFKGSWLAIWLLELGADVYGYALPPKTEMDNFVVCDLKNKIKHIDGDIRDREKLLQFFQQVKPEFVFHMAAQPLVLESYENPHYTYETNIMGTVNFFEAVRETQSVKVAINITSDKCYKNEEWIWGYRENDPLGGKDPYSSSKACSEIITEAYLYSFFQNNTCNIASVRAGNVIGAGDWAADRIVPDFFRALINNETLKIRRPNAVRPWQHVLEPLGGYLYLAASLYKSKNYQGSWNFGPVNFSMYKVIDLINAIKSHIPDYDVRIDLENDQRHEATYLSLDISKVKYFLGWQPVLNFDETVKLTVDGYLSDILNKEEPYNNRLRTIEKYLEIGIKKNIKWIKEN